MAKAQEKAKERGTFGMFKKGKKSMTWNGHPNQNALAILDEEGDTSDI
jgi:hypothetical protein